MDFSIIGRIGFAALNIFVIIFTIAVIATLIFILFRMYLKWKRYSEFDCTIFETSGFGQQVETHDRAGIFVEGKTKDKKFFLKKGNIGLDCDHVPYIPTSYGKKRVYLLKTGLKEYRFLKMNTITDKGIYPEVGEEDVNWAIHVYEKQKKMFQNTWLAQYGPMLVLAFVCIVILIIFIFFFRKFDVLADVARAFEGAAEHLSAARAGTVVIK